MGNSTKSRASHKPVDTRPEKPKGYPLFLHRTGRIAKKVRGKLHYFGRWGIVEKGKVIPVDDLSAALGEALDLWNDQRSDLMAGRKPRKASEDGLTVERLVNEYLTAKRRLLVSGELSKTTFAEYHHAGAQVVAAFGWDRLVSDLTSEDFGKLRSKLSETHGPVTLANDVQRIRMIFRWGVDAGKIKAPVPYGQEFNKPRAKTIRHSRAAAGSPMFTADELRLILGYLAGEKVTAFRVDDETGKPAQVQRTANPQLLAMTLLAVNAGFGQGDCASLPLSALDLNGGWVSYPRPKTGIERRAKLWPETIRAVRGAIAIRPAASKPEDESRVFLTANGKPWLRQSESDDPGAWGSRTDLIGRDFSRVLKELGINGRRGFYGCRHSFRTAADGARDHVAIDRIMGHVDPSMGANYRHAIDDSRLEAVAESVRVWLFGNGGAK